MDQNDLFAEVRAQKLARLRELGWVLRHHWGSDLWVNPDTKAFYSEEAALAWLDKHESAIG